MHSHQQWLRVPTALHSRQKLSLFGIFNNSNRCVVVSHFIIILIFSTLNDIWSLNIFSFAYLLSKCLWWGSALLPIFKIELFFYYWVLIIFWCILDTSILSDICFAVIFLPVFNLSVCSFNIVYPRDIFNFNEIHFFFLGIYFCCYHSDFFLLFIF